MGLTIKKKLFSCDAYSERFLRSLQQIFYELSDIYNCDDFYFKISINSEILFSEFGVSDLFAVPSGSQLI
jgi:hypothetical protein